MNYLRDRIHQMRNEPRKVTVCMQSFAIGLIVGGALVGLAAVGLIAGYFRTNCPY